MERSFDATSRSAGRSPARHRRHGATGSWHRELRGDVDLARLRHEARGFLRRSGIDEQLAGDVVLVLTELVVNVSEATDGATSTAHIDILTPELLSVVVTNPPVDDRLGPEALPVTMPGVGSVRGRGLPLVAALSTRLSVDLQPTVTTVVADFHC